MSVAVKGDRNDTEKPKAGGVMEGRFGGVLSQVSAAGALIVVFIFLTFASPVFLTATNLFNVATQTAVVAIIAIGMTFVIITAGIDLLVGSVAALAGVLGVQLMVYYGVPWPLAVLLGTLAGGLIGLLNGFLITVAGMAPFIATLGMLSVARGLVYIITNAVSVFGAPNSFKVLGQGTIFSFPVPLIFLIIIAVGGHFLLSRTRLGRYSYAIGSNPEAARLSGIPVKRYLIRV